MIATALQTSATPGQPGRRAVPAGRRRAAETQPRNGVARQAARAASAAPRRQEDCAGLVLVLETQGQFTPAPPEPAWADPRPDLAADHARWLTLLELAHRRDGADPQGVFGALVGIRCCGAAIASSGGANPAWRLLRGELSAAAWQAARAQWLTPALALARSAGASVPHLKVLQGLLGAPAAAPAAEAQNL